MLRPGDDEGGLAEPEARAEILRGGFDQEFRIAVELRHMIPAAGMAQELRPVERRVQTEKMLGSAAPSVNREFPHSGVSIL